MPLRGALPSHWQFMKFAAVCMWAVFPVGVSQLCEGGVAQHSEKSMHPYHSVESVEVARCLYPRLGLLQNWDRCTFLCLPNAVFILCLQRLTTFSSTTWWMFRIVLLHDIKSYVATQTFHGRWMNSAIRCFLTVGEQDVPSCFNQMPQQQFGGPGMMKYDEVWFWFSSRLQVSWLQACQSPIEPACSGAKSCNLVGCQV